VRADARSRRREPPAPRGNPGSRPAGQRPWGVPGARQPPPPPPPPPPPLPRPEAPVDALAGPAPPALCFSQARSELLFRPGGDFYNLMPLRAPALAAFVLNIVGLAAVGFLLVHWIRRVRQPAWRRLAAGAAAAAFLVFLNSARLTHELMSRWTDVP